MSFKEQRIQEINSLAETKFLSLYDIKYKNKIGKIKSWTVASRKNLEALKQQHFNGKKEKTDAVVIFAVHKESKKLVLIKQFRVPVNNFMYELPAGLIDGEEKIEEALRRELKEETGLTLLEIDSSKKLLPVYASGGMTDESMAIMFCVCEGVPSIDYLEEDEDLEIKLVSQEEAAELLKQDIKIDAKAYLALHLFAMVGEKSVNLY
ncbi:ADP-ribose pyrophosphatase [Clostridium amylolyticum]|uniref:ADP-ribose pyrophosphatase n=1 Tax=Clostridium amylolyticum TaxID=1121298 RepID=A0A1M6IRS0_9CLOT|nr:NUDIX hydrolase [Clostridium amylolyticum]SHJ37029.1 ADP-ribose pyrophosphatase [Clostridium amylolyticum]